MELTEKARTLADMQLCDYCLGRQFGRLGYGLENDERGRLVRHAVEADTPITEELFATETIPETTAGTESCMVCHSRCQRITDYAAIVVDALKPYEYETFLIGTRLPAHIQRAEEEIWEQVGIEHVEPLKSELNRRIGKIVQEQTDKTVAFERPDITVIFDIGEERPNVQLHSLFLFGRYNKLQRGIPQTKWPCRSCKGMGCEECNYVGKQFQTSVEECVAEPVLEATYGLETKFHGAGREDVDALCYGKRPFVIEVIEPEVRELDLEQLQKTINERYVDQIKIFDVQFTDKQTVQSIKEDRYDKTYQLVVEFERAVTDTELKALDQLVGRVQQNTPERVEHRRAQKVRTRQIKAVEWERLAEDRIALTITAEAGTYMKELVTGDKEQTQPNVAELVGIPAQWETLDVLDIHEDES